DRRRTGSFTKARGRNRCSIVTPLSKGESSMKTEHRHTPRYPFSALAEIVDEAENARTSSRVSDLSLRGCYVEMNNPFPEGTKVTIEISTETESLETYAIVAHIEPKRGMGLTF